MVKQTRSATKRKRKRKVVEEYYSYVVEIRDWELTYSLGLNPNPKHFDGQYWESLHLIVKGLIQLPEKYATKDIVY